MLPVKPWPLIVLAAAALALCACGSSSSTTATRLSARVAAASNALKFSDCMRSHGVPNFPDPIVHGNSVQISIRAGSGITPFSPSFRAAQSTCSKLVPNGGPASVGVPSAAAMKQTLAMSECMRAHGVTGFPDPTTTPPKGGPGQGGVGLVIGHNGLFLALPSSIDPSSLAFQQASRTCGFVSPGGAPSSAGADSGY